MGMEIYMQKTNTIKIAVAIVTNRLIKPKTLLSIMMMLAHTKYEVVPIVATEGYTTAEGRTYCVIQAKKNDCTHILFIDDDMIFPEDTIEQLLSANVEIVGVPSNSRTLPLSTTVALLDENGGYKNPDKYPDFEMQIPYEVFKCYSIGMGVALIDMEVFNKIDRPWFKFVVNEELGKIMIGEDAWLCKKAREKGIDIWCDGTFEVGHIGDYIY